jgi:hypothetical protein
MVKILLDCDVVRHFIKGECLNILYDLYGERLFFLDVVLDELFRSRHIRTRVENFISFYAILVDTIAEYRVLKRNIE